MGKIRQITDPLIWIQIPLLMCRPSFPCVRDKEASIFSTRQEFDMNRQCLELIDLSFLLHMLAY